MAAAETPLSASERAAVAEACGLGPEVLLRVSVERALGPLRWLNVSGERQSPRRVAGHTTGAAVCAPQVAVQLGPFLQRAGPVTSPAHLAETVAWLYGTEARGVLHTGPAGHAAHVVPPSELAEPDVQAAVRATGFFATPTWSTRSDGRGELRFFTRWSAEVGGSGVSDVRLSVAPDGTVEAVATRVPTGAPEVLPTSLDAFVRLADDGTALGLARRLAYLYRWTNLGAPAPAWLDRVQRGKRRLVERDLGATKALYDDLVAAHSAPEPSRVVDANGETVIAFYLLLTPRQPTGEFAGRELYQVRLTLTRDGRPLLNASAVALPR